MAKNHYILDVNIYTYLDVRNMYHLVRKISKWAIENNFILKLYNDHINTINIKYHRRYIVLRQSKQVFILYINYCYTFINPLKPLNVY